jgi:hypothetical protein
MENQGELENAEKKQAELHLISTRASPENGKSR